MEYTLLKKDKKLKPSFALVCLEDLFPESHWVLMTPAITVNYHILLYPISVQECGTIVTTGVTMTHAGTLAQWLVCLE